MCHFYFYDTILTFCWCHSMTADFLLRSCRPNAFHQSRASEMRLRRESDRSSSVGDSNSNTVNDWVSAVRNVQPTWMWSSFSGFLLHCHLALNTQIMCLAHILYVWACCQWWFIYWSSGFCFTSCWGDRRGWNKTYSRIENKNPNNLAQRQTKQAHVCFSLVVLVNPDLHILIDHHAE